MAKYTGRINAVETNQVFVISGRAGQTPNRFDIDFHSGNAHGIDNGDIPLHLSIRFVGNGEIVRNSHSKGVGWGREERLENMFPNNLFNPIQRGEDFKISIYVDTNMFFITINEKPYCTFPFRKPLNQIQFISIWKDVEAIYQVDQVTAQPSRWPAIVESEFSALAPKPFKAGNVIVITATPRGVKADFTIRMMEGGTKRQMLHLRNYLNSNTIVTDSQDDNLNWKNHVKHAPCPFPFIIGQRFKLAIGITSNDFVIAANGKYLVSMPYRDSVEKIFNNMMGVDIVSSAGHKLEVHGVDFMATSDGQCKSIETYSRL